LHSKKIEIQNIIKYDVVSPPIPYLTRLSNITKKMSSIPDSWIPEQYLDDITSEVMTDPVIDPTTGQTYDRKNIERWIREKGISPGSRQPLTIAQLKPNVKLAEGLASMMARFAAGYTGPGASIAPVATAVSSAATSNSSSNSSSSSTKPFEDAPVQAEAQTYSIDGQQYLTITCSAPIDGVVQLTDYYLLLDISGSMNNSTRIEIEGKKYDISRWYLVQHCVRVLTALLQGRGRICLIIYNSSAKVLQPLTSVTKASVDQVTHALQAITPTSGTNIFAAIQLVTQQIAEQPATNRSVVLLLTDGIPTPDYTPLGLVKTIRSTIKPTIPFTLHSMGFGNDLDTGLLQDIAIWGGGRFLHAPSKEMVGTVIMNFATSELATASRSHPITYSSVTEPITIPTGLIVFGQPRIITIPVPSADILVGFYLSEVPLVKAEPSPYLLTRQLLLNVLQKVLQEHRVAKQRRRTAEGLMEYLSNLADRIGHFDDEKVKAMLEDIRGELTTATQYMDSWGEPYIAAYMDGIRNSVPFNFKDKGLLIYVGPMMERLLEEANSIFMSVDPLPLPAPFEERMLSPEMPAGPPPTSRGYSQALYDAGGSCFVAGTPVTVHVGNQTIIKPIQDVRRGDLVASSFGPARVAYSIRFGTFAPLTSVTKLTDHLTVTPYHPVRFQNGGWKNPIGLGVTTHEAIPAVYNLILEEHHNILIDGIVCVTLAHGLQEEGVAHPFFGTKSCLDALARCPGFNDGHPIFQNCVAVKGLNNLVIDWEDRV
jgi:uncharacterized protein YegL